MDNLAREKKETEKLAPVFSRLLSFFLYIHHSRFLLFIPPYHWQPLLLLRRTSNLYLENNVCSRACIGALCSPHSLPLLVTI